MRPLPPAAIAAIDRGQLIEAIKIVRDQTGLGLKESKDAVDRHVAGDLAPLHDVRGSATSATGFAYSDDSGSALPAAARAALLRGNKVEAIKIVREAKGLGLSQAKDLVEAHAEGRPSPVARGEAQLDHLLQGAMAEPGRVNASRWGSPALWLVVAVVAGLAWLYLNGSL